MPDHSTVSKNRYGRFRDSDIDRVLFEIVVGQCRQAGLIPGEGFAVDGSFVHGDARRDLRLQTAESTREGDTSAKPVRGDLQALDAGNSTHGGAKYHFQLIPARHGTLRKGAAGLVISPTMSTPRMTILHFVKTHVGYQNRLRPGFLQPQRSFVQDRGPFPSPPWFLQAHGFRLMPESCAGAPATALPNATRAPLIAQAFRLEWFTVAWMTIECAVAIGAGIIAHSISLTAFGIDSLIELASAGLLIWRLSVELKHGQSFSEKAERVASKISGVMLFALAAYIIVAAGWGLWTREGEAFSSPGLVVTVLAIPIMYLLAKRKLAVAAKLGSRALRADAVEAITCGWLSFVIVLGLLTQIALNAWWVDSVTSLAILCLVVKEGREAWQGEECCADD